MDGLFDTPPKFFFGFAFPSKHRQIFVGNRGRGVVLGRKDVTGAPANFGTKIHQGFDQHRGLDGHVNTARNARALEGSFAGKLCTQGHQSGHFCLGNGDFFMAPLCELNIGNFIVLKCGHWSYFSSK